MQVASIVTHESAPPALLAFCSRHATGVVSLMCAGKRTHGVVNVVQMYCSSRPQCQTVSHKVNRQQVLDLYMGFCFKSTLLGLQKPLKVLKNHANCQLLLLVIDEGDSVQCESLERFFKLVDFYLNSQVGFTVVVEMTS